MNKGQFWALAALAGLGFMVFYQYIQAEKSIEKGAEINGLDTRVLNDLTLRLKKDPNIGRVTFFSDTKWQTGMRSITTFEGYKVDGQMKHEKTRKLVLQGDELEELSGTDTAPGAVEELMYAVGTCISAAANAKASLIGVKLTKLEVNLESDIDMHGLMAVDPKVRPGILDFRTKITIAGDASEEKLKEIALFGYNYSPVSDTVRKGVTRAAKPEIIVESTKK